MHTNNTPNFANGINPNSVSSTNNGIRYPSANHYINYNVYSSVQYCQTTGPPQMQPAYPTSNPNGQCMMPPYTYSHPPSGGSGHPPIVPPYMMQPSRPPHMNHFVVPPQQHTIVNNNQQKASIPYQPNMQHHLPPFPMSTPPYFPAQHQSQNYPNAPTNCSG